MIYSGYSTLPTRSSTNHTLLIMTLIVSPIETFFTKILLFILKFIKTLLIISQITSTYSTFGGKSPNKNLELNLFDSFKEYLISILQNYPFDIHNCLQSQERKCKLNVLLDHIVERSNRHYNILDKILWLKILLKQLNLIFE